MNADRVKTWTSQILECVQDGRPTEDARVECKSSWVDVKNIARQLAGHANAALGEPILWLIGVDEKGKRIPGADATELANWYPRLKKEFDDGIAPALVADLNLSVDGAIVVALVFETITAPFIIKVPNTDRLEIPWREGTRTRSANRVEVFRMLSLLQDRGVLLPIKEFANETPRAQKLALTRPPYWEYLLTVELLKTKLRQVRRNYDEVSDGLVFRKIRKLSGREFTNVVQEKMSDLLVLTDIFKSCVEKEIPASWGRPGEPGDALEIKRATDRLIAGCNEFVHWETQVASLEPPKAFDKLLLLMRGLTTQMLSELERFTTEMSDIFEQPNPSGEYDINLRFDYPEGRIEQITSEASRVAKIIEKDVDQWN
jgi:hypothetical protein